QGRYREGSVECRIGHELGSMQKSWPYPSADWVRDADRMAGLADRLPALLSGEAQPTDAGERVTLALALMYQGERNLPAARSCAASFAAQGASGEGLERLYRVPAACHAAKGAAGKGEDAAHLDDAERAGLRGQALQWLSAELGAWAKLADNTADRPKVRQ